MSDDTDIKLAIMIMVTFGLLIGSLVVITTRDFTTNNDICKKLYTNTTDFFKCTTNDLKNTINLIQPLKGEQ